MMFKKYWYKYTYTECPICGRQDKIKERLYGEKPKDIELRHIFIQDACISHFHEV